MKKYIEIFKYSLKQNMTFKVNYMFSIISLAIHLFVFNELWDYILQGKTETIARLFLTKIDRKP